MKKLTLAGKLTLGLLLVGLVFLTKWLLVDSEYIFTKEVKQSVNVQQIVLPDAPKTTSGQNVEAVALPTDEVATVNSPRITMEIMAWNSQMGLNFANGGPQTTKGSLMEKHNVNLSIKRQDDCNQMAQNLIKFANDYKNNPTTAVGTNFIAIMGDGGPAWLSGVNAELAKLGDEYTAQIFYSCGKSQGEDKFMAPPAVKENPQNAKGLVCAAVLRDGDWNIVVKWCSDNGIRVNTDETTYDPEAMNFVAANDFIDAAQKYISGYSEERAVVKVDPATGKTVKTGEKKKVTVNCSTTWTPGDVMIAENKGGLVSIVSTAEYRSQMPNIVIGIKKWLQDNRNHVVNFIVAASEGGDQVKSFDAALNKAGEISAKIYNEKDGSYWVRYYRGIKQTDKDGNLVELGGSRAHNLADNLELFGLGENKTNTYASVYKVFGDVVSSLYPEYVSTYPKIEDVLDLSYIISAKSKATNLTSADKVAYTESSDMSETVAKRAWSIEFESGKSTITPAGQRTLEDLYDQLVIASGLKVEIFGHTDNTGTAEGNDVLSQQRAEAVKQWLQNKSNTNFPNSRFAKVEGKGQREPIADNGSNSGRAKNRRVEIVMGK
jgi:outer membrane protein OmpA-like peptidoglycan-associated protein